MTSRQLALFNSATFPEPEPCGTTVVSWGLGADSTAIILRFLENPTAYGLRPDLSDLILITAHTGMEWPDSIALAEQHVLPLLRAHRVRYVQIARGGASIAQCGIEILSDTRNPTRIHASGRWSLLLDLRESGTVPMYGGNRLCSIRAKGEPLDLWFKEHLTGPYRHVVGFELGELGRARVDTSFAKPGRRPWYPLINWGWDRPTLLAYLKGRLGVSYPKSFCWACPYPVSAGSLPDHMARSKRFPAQIAEAAMLEYTAQALNPLFTLYAKSSLREELHRAGNTAALDLLADRLDTQPWSIYEVRRVLTAGRSEYCDKWHGPRCAACVTQARYWGLEVEEWSRCKGCRAISKPKCPRRDPLCSDPQRKGTVWRSVRRVGVLTRRQARTGLQRFADRPGRTLEHTASAVPGYDFGFERVVTASRGGSYPAVERQFVAAPATVPTKARSGFETAWRSAVDSIEAAEGQPLGPRTLAVV
ncbi:hypothetical protein ACGF12_22575 [Kitasatospora sp. NPDC048296]|uniref:hypothetical protein n=1 Tax=Kitasatospora sp. NPDC048296 TaxID=3364048 RepID=UPI003712ADB5